MFDEIKILLAQGQINIAVEKLIEVSSELNDRDLQNYIISTSARFNIHLKKVNLGIKKNDEDGQKIVYDILLLIDEIETRIGVPNSLKVSNTLSRPEIFEKYYDLKSVIEDSQNLSETELQDAYIKSIEIKQLLYDEIDLKFKKEYPSIIFNRLYFSDILFEIEIIQLKSLPSDKSYTWYEKSIVVTALTLSLLRKFDPTKIEILLSFLNEFEHMVWQRALVGIVLGLYNRENLILLYPNLVKRLSELKEIKRIRNGIKAITISLYSKTYKHFYDDLREFYDNVEYGDFKSPQHWFVPFYPRNPTLQEELLSLPNVNDIHLLPNLLTNDRHLSNSEKYAFIKALKKWPEERVSQFIALLQDSSLCRRDHEYDLYIRDIFNFATNYKDENIELEMEEPRVLYTSNIYDLILKEKYIPYVKAEVCNEVGEYNDAISWYKKYIIQDPKNSFVYCQMGTIYEQLESFDEAIEMHEKAFQLDISHTHSFFSLSRCYYKLGNKEKIIDSLNRLSRIKKKTKKDFYWLSIGYIKYLKDYEKAIEPLNELSKYKDPEYNWEVYKSLGKIYTLKGDLKNAKLNFAKSIEIQANSNKESHRYLLVIEYYEMEKPNDFNWWKNGTRYFKDEKAVESFLDVFENEIGTESF